MRNRAPTVVPSGRPMARWQAERGVERWAKSKGRTMPSQTGTALSREAHRRRDSARSSERCPTCPLPPLGPIPRASRARTAQPLIGQRAAPRSIFFSITNKRPSLPAAARAGMVPMRGMQSHDGMWVLRRQMTALSITPSPRDLHNAVLRSDRFDTGHRLALQNLPTGRPSFTDRLIRNKKLHSS